MKTTLKISIIIAMLGLTLSSCYWHNWDTVHPNASAATPPCTVDTGTVISYTANVVAIINSKCSISGCHSAGGTGSANDFTFYGTSGSHGSSGLVAVCSGDTSGSSAWQDIAGNVGSDPMPKSGYPALTPCEKATLRNWIHQGAQNN